MEFGGAFVCMNVCVFWFETDCGVCAVPCSLPHSTTPELRSDHRMGRDASRLICACVCLFECLLGSFVVVAVETAIAFPRRLPLPCQESIILAI